MRKFQIIISRDFWMEYRYGAERTWVILIGKCVTVGSELHFRELKVRAVDI